MSNNYIATKTVVSTAMRRGLLALALCFAGAGAFAAGTTAGSVTHLSGPLLAKKADGTIKVLSQQSLVEQGDTLVTEKDTYARIKFIDNSEMTLRPNSQLKIDSFSFDEGKKDSDSALFSLIKGGLRAVTGLLGKRSKERFGLNTPTATIGIRGTIFIADYVSPTDHALSAYSRASMAAANSAAMLPTEFRLTDTPRSDAFDEAEVAGGIVPLQLAASNPDSPPGGDDRPPGLYVQVLDGLIHVTNGGGAQDFGAGQFGFTPDFKIPPVVLPNDPGIHFTPPPSFTPPPGQGDKGKDGKSGNIDCQVH